MIDYVGSFEIGDEYIKVNIFRDNVTGEIFENLDLPVDYKFKDESKTLDAKFVILSSEVDEFEIERELKIAEGVAKGYHYENDIYKDFKFEVYAIWRAVDANEEEYCGLGIAIRLEEWLDDCESTEDSISLYGSGMVGYTVSTCIGRDYAHSCFMFRDLLGYVLRRLDLNIELENSESYRLNGFENCRWVI